MGGSAEYEARERERKPLAITNAVEFFCTDGEGRWLLHERGPACRDEVGKWGFGGGKMEAGEDRFRCLLRELREEYGRGIHLYASRQLPGFTLLRHNAYAIVEHLEVHPFACLVEKKSVDLTALQREGKAGAWGWFEIARRLEGDRLPEIVNLPREAWNSAESYVLERYVGEFVGDQSLSHAKSSGSLSQWGLPLPLGWIGSDSIKTRPLFVLVGNDPLGSRPDPVEVHLEQRYRESLASEGNRRSLLEGEFAPEKPAEEGKDHA